jgi:hypothetical protein
MIHRNLKLLIALIIVGTIAAYVLIVTIPAHLAEKSYEAAKTLGKDFRNAFQFTPEIKVNNKIILNQQTPVLELSVLSQNFEHRYTWINSWMGSTKKINITGSFDTKVGFDLQQKFSITLTDDQAIVLLPEPIVLSVESKGDIEYRDENGIWNWVDSEDRTKATNAFITDARRYAEQAAFVQEAKKGMEEKLQVLLQPHAKTVIVRYDSPVDLPMRQ